MKAIVFHTFGPPDVLQWEETDEPQAGPGQVRVRVKAAGVQPFDTAVRSGPWPMYPVKFPQKLGNEFAGVIDQVGDGAAGFAVGSEVLGWAPMSCYAEYVVVGSDQVVAKPKSMPWEEAGVLSASGQTAHRALQLLGVGRGDTVLVHAAAGGVGTVAVQLARAWGATVIGTASPRNHDYLRALGAIPVAYGEGLAERVRALAPNGVDAALDAVGGDALLVSVELVADKSRVGTLVDAELAERLGARWLQSQRTAERLAELVELYEQGKLRIHIWKSFPMSEAAEAHREVETGHVRGKVVLLTE
ncbi:NADP-dependent oxidoreductase [Paenibacillus flagellatus]|uniref:Alcohol dehydrogenase n=1 Tax=Paenibacillus flagellatus TaxID=2211139 RepID=A0A2V5K8V5_9BACL|nr:NADP-dependent oxidoreductase [Paenibacillus flagellatus]PYI54253.1 alcohol dehydrogenase [Paenibacillus flagellatus]